MHLNDIAQDCWQTAENSGFHKLNQTFTESMMLVVTECAEAVEEFRNGNEPNEVYWIDTRTKQRVSISHVISATDVKYIKPEGAPIEMADAIIRLLENMIHLGLDPEAVILEKMSYNKKRPYLHGGKKL